MPAVDYLISVYLFSYNMYKQWVNLFTSNIYYETKRKLCKIYLHNLDALKHAYCVPPPQKKSPGGRHSAKKGMIGSDVSGIADEEERSSGPGEDIVLLSGARGGGRIRGWKRS